MLNSVCDFVSRSVMNKKMAYIVGSSVGAILVNRSFFRNALTDFVNRGRSAQYLMNPTSTDNECSIENVFITSACSATGAVYGHAITVILIEFPWLIPVVLVEKNIRGFLYPNNDSSNTSSDTSSDTSSNTSSNTSSDNSENETKDE